MKLFKKSKAYGMFEYTVVAAGVIAISLIIANSMKKEYEVGPKLIKGPVAQLEKMFIEDVEGGGSGGTGGSISASLCANYFVYSEEGILFEEFKTFLETCLILRDSNGNKINDYEIENVSIAGGFAQGTVSANDYEETVQIKAREFNEVDVVFNELSSGSDVSRVVSSGNSTYFLMDDGSVIGAGMNNNGQLGQGHTNAILSKVSINIGIDQPVRKIYADNGAVFFILENDTVRALGNNSFGNLGIGNNLNISEASTSIYNPGSIPFSKVKDLIMGGNSTFILLEDGRVFATGANSSGQLGVNGTTSLTSFREVPGLEGGKVKKIISNGGSTFIIMDDGTVRATGYNAFGHLGFGNTTRRTQLGTIPGLSNVKDVAIGQSSYSAFFLINDGTVMVTGSNTSRHLCIEETEVLSPTQIPGLINVKKIIIDSFSTFFIMENGTVKTCGINNYGQLGVGHTNNVTSLTQIPDIENVKKVITDSGSTFFLLNDGTVKSTGYNHRGQLGLRDTNNRNTPTLIPIENVRNISSVDSSTFFTMQNGTVLAVGHNGGGQLGLGDYTRRDNPSLVPGIQFNFSSTLESITLSGDIEKAEGIFSKSSNHSGITETNWTNLGSAQGQTTINEPSEAGDWYYHIKITDKLGNTKWFSSGKLSY